MSSHIGSVTNHSLWNNQDTSIAVFDDVAMVLRADKGDGTASLLKEWILDVVDAGFGKDVMVVLVGEADDVAGRDDDFLVEYFLYVYVCVCVRERLEQKNVLIQHDNNTLNTHTHTHIHSHTHSLTHLHRASNHNQESNTLPIAISL
jgi:hypothetical protein